MIRKPTAADIANDMLTRTGDAMASGDFDAFIKHFTTPLIIETFESKRILQTRRDIERVFDAMRAFRSVHAVKAIVRENVAADYIDADTIAATHVARVLQSGDVLLGRPYPVYSLLKLSKNGWQIQFCQYAVDEPSQLNDALAGRKTKTPRNPAASSIT
ncbi:MAG: hypothetical protein AAGA06_00970 [Pseudomonadota bacterium]